MKIRNKAIATTLIGASLLTNMMPVFANENPHKDKDLKPVLISAEKPVPVLINNAPNKSVNVNIDGKIVTFPDQKPILIKAESRTIVPVRFITEHLGGTVSWDEDTKTAMIKLDGKKVELPVNKKYAKVDGEQVELDSSAKLISNRTFVPLRFVCETFGYDVSWDDKTDTVKLNKKDDNVYTGGSKYFDEELGLYKMFGNVTNIENDTILVEGEGLYNQIKFNINEDTEIVDLDGMKLSKDDIKDASEIIVYHDQKMTRSLPPIANAQKIVVADLNVKDGKISQITDVKNGKMFLVGSMNDGINFNITDKTVIVNEAEQKLTSDALTKGADVEVYYGNIMTMSLPPITSAKKIVVKGVYTMTGNVKTIQKNSILVEGEGLYDQIKFNITDETKIVDKEGKELSKSDIKEGSKVVAYHGGAMTRSLPPITNATKIIVE
ncbi:stalk domain-containing protein [Tepidibacter aestuarii]|uniref:stalk domain-containing protein n=1 Tax=Tepidibacter aestuarii TaxID=2925782 RepID=UPI0020BD8F73|nr:stalk domain-containing protein [Tepidibacter aestuarii]CAH2212058.1 putative Predicted secreted protein [Tepidibacter aestuarii]